MSKKLDASKEYHRFVVQENKAGEFFVVFAYKDEIIFRTEGYATKSNALRAIGNIKRHSPLAPAYDITAAVEIEL